jgi:predicted DNA-binding transcriptional regulator AlpA
MAAHSTLTPTTLIRRTQQSNDSEYLTAAQLMARYGGVSHMWLLRRTAKDGFPKPVYFGRLRFWRRTEIESWERSKAVQS